MPTSNTVCVCLLAYNHAHTLARAVDSVLAQHHSEFELILSDDCSTDSTWEVIQSLARKDSRVRPLRTPRNLGMAGNANFAVAQSDSEYIALLHHDDVYSPKLLTRWLDVARRHPKVAFVSNSYAHGDSHVDYHAFDECTDGKRALEEHLFPNWGCPIWGTTLIRRVCWDAVGGMRERFGMLADVDLWMRLAARWDVGYVREPLITLIHERPQDYPEAYLGWSWERLKLLYDIHAINRSEYYASNRVRHNFESFKFRVRVTANELRWLATATAKRRWHMLATSELLDNPYELPIARLVRKASASLAQTFFSSARS